jgi:FkbM family methyltransferase
MNYVDERGERVDTSTQEVPEQKIAKLLIPRGAKVLELGARYGTVTCQIAASVGPEGVVVTVEPDATVWGALQTNLDANRCKATVLKGFVSETPLQLTGAGYGTHAVASSSSEHTFTLQQAQQAGNVEFFDTLVADCEGCLETFFQENPTFLDNLHTVIFEADRPKACNYRHIRHMLKSNGFQSVVSGFQNAWIKHRTLDASAERELRALSTNMRLLRVGVLIFVAFAGILIWRGVLTSKRQI